jgi:hypothetical protein
LFVTVTLHWLPHAVALFGEQHVPVVRHTWPLGQLGELATPQLTVRPQLFVTWPHCRLPQAAWSVSGVQPHTLLVHVPPSHAPQSIGDPQLSVVIWQRPLHQFDCDWQTHMFAALQVSPVGQSVGQTRV